MKSKNLDVVAEYQKLKQKRAANFVVIGTFILIDDPVWLLLMMHIL